MTRLDWEGAARRDHCRKRVPAAPTYQQLAALDYVRSDISTSKFLADLRRHAEHDGGWVPTKAQAKIVLRIKQERTGCHFSAPIESLAERRARRQLVLVEAS